MGEGPSTTPMDLRRIAAALLILAALINGLAGPWAHGHAFAGVPASTQEAPLQAAQLTVGDQAQHTDCDAAEHEAAQQPHQPGGHPHGKASGDAICSGALTCCGAIVLYDLPIVTTDRQFEAWAMLPLSLNGLTPPVGERPPLSPHV